MRRTSRVSHPAPKRRESKTECGRGVLPLMDWQKFPRLRCRPSRSSSRQTTQADGAVLILSSYRAKSRHPAKLPSSQATGFPDFAPNENGVFGCQLVNPKFRGRFDQRRVRRQVCGKLWTRMQPPKSISGEDKMGCSAATQLFEILDCLLAIIRIAVVNRVVLQKVPALALGIIKDSRIAHVRGHDQCTRRCHFFQF